MLPTIGHNSGQPFARPRGAEPTPAIARDLPFGITTIIGGTNLRFSLSSPVTSSSIDTAISWQELLQVSSSRTKGLNVSSSKAAAYEDIARRFVDFIEAKSDRLPKGPPFSQLHTITFSVAGIVDGNKVSLTNVPLGIHQEDLASQLLGAINAELSRRGFETCSPKVVTVVNDAVGGLMGELRAGGLQGIKHGAFIILGTGMGGICCVNAVPYSDLAELGHRLIINEHDRSVRILVGDAISPFLSDRGEFAVLSNGDAYMEHHVAGPWVATRFVKAIAAAGQPLVNTLSQRLASAHGLPDGAVLAGLTALKRLPSAELNLWGQQAPADTVRLINEFLFNPDAAAVIQAKRHIKAGGTGFAERLTDAGYQTWRDYFGLLGQCGAAINNALQEIDSAAERIVLGGGIGEACNYYPQTWKKHAYAILHESAQLSPGSVIFSPIRAEQRENVITTTSIQEAIQGAATVYH